MTDVQAGPNIMRFLCLLPLSLTSLRQCDVLPALTHPGLLPADGQRRPRDWSHGVVTWGCHMVATSCSGVGGSHDLHVPTCSVGARASIINGDKEANIAQACTIESTHVD